MMTDTDCVPHIHLAMLKINSPYPNPIQIWSLEAKIVMLETELGKMDDKTKAFVNPGNRTRRGSVHERNPEM